MDASDQSGAGTGGPAATAQGKVTTAVFADYQALKRQENSTAPGLYSAPSAKENLNIVNREVLFQIVKPSLVLDSKGALTVSMGDGKAKVQSSANGAFADIVQMFPDEPEIQLAAATNQIKFAGIASGSHKYEKSDAQGLAAQHRGIFSTLALQKIPVGYYSQIRLPHPNDFKNETRVVREGILPSKATLEVVPYRPESVSVRWGAIMKAYLKDKQMFLRAFGARLQRTESIIGAVDAQMHFVLVSTLAVLNSLTEANAITWDFVDGGAFDMMRRDRGVFPTQKQQLVGLARGFSVIGDPASSEPAVSRMTDARANAWADLVRVAMRSVFYDGEAANLSLSYDSGTGRVLGKDSTTGNLLRQDAYGQMLHQQLNAYKGFLTAVNQALLQEHEMIIGKFVKGTSSYFIVSMAVLTNSLGADREGTADVIM